MTSPLQSNRRQKQDASRREFLKSSSAAIVAGGTLAISRSAHAAGNDTLKIGLIGCGGRGKSAAGNALKADPNTKLTALCEIFPDRLLAARDQFESSPHADRVELDDERCFTGFNGYREMMATDVDVVLLCTPPHFRPAQLRAAIESGKHVFCEKPVAVDATGVRHVLESVKMAKDKDLSLVSGLCWRYDHAVLEVMRRIFDGAIGDIVAIQENYLASPLWHRGRRPDWSEMEYQLRNWLYFAWLSGDHIVEQHIHSLDKALWLMGDEPPMNCFGLGGRQVRTGEKWGHIFDHFAVCYEWKNGVKTFAYTRQMRDCHNNVEDYVLGTKGRAKILKFEIDGESKWKWPRRQRRPSMYDAEHVALFNGIRAGEHINNGTYMSYSTLMAIMGREACYTGKQITWDEALSSDQDLSPASYAWGDLPVPEVAKPGIA